VTKKIFLATENMHKVKEFSALTKDRNINFYLPPNDISPFPEETGTTFAENAILKTLHVERECNLPSLADDSGLEVDYLNGMPGIHSSRYSQTGNSEDNITKLLEKLSGVKENYRSARFKCCLAYNRANGSLPLVFEASITGVITKKRIGSSGFGYDSVFFVPVENMTFAEMNENLKNNISHRYLAFQKFWLESNNLDLLEDYV